MKYIITILISFNAYCGALQSEKLDLESHLINIMQITSNAKGISINHASPISYSAAKAADKFKVPVNIVLAIACVESHYKLNAVNPVSNDYGIMQVNQYHIDHAGVDKQRLLTDMDYSFEQGVKVFEWFYRKYPLDEAFMRYNCGTKPSCVKQERVKKYLKNIRKAL